MNKISATILDFASPLTSGLGSDAPIEAHRDALRIATTVWNAVVLEACGNSEFVTELLGKAGEAGRQDSGAAGAVIRELVRRKRALYAEDLRLVGEWELRTVGKGEISLRAVAHAAPLR